MTDTRTVTDTTTMTVLVTAAACSRPATSSGNEGAIKAGYSAGFLDSPFNSGLVKAVVDEANQNGFDMLPPTDAQSDPAKQVTDVQTLLSRNIEALVLTPQDSDAIIPAVEAANAAMISWARHTRATIANPVAAPAKRPMRAAEVSPKLRRTKKPSIPAKARASARSRESARGAMVGSIKRPMRPA